MSEQRLDAAAAADVIETIAAAAERSLTEDERAELATQLEKIQ